jgi:hypothetical protein
MEDKPAQWRPLAAGEVVPADRSLVALFGADLLSGNGAVAIQMLGDVGEHGAYPALESAIIVHNNPAFDLDVTLERGVVAVSNRKKDAAVKIRVRFLEDNLDVTLPDGTAKVAIERYSRHLPGPARLDQAKDDIPVTNLFILAMAGEPTIAGEHRRVSLQAPPGTALLHWDSATRDFETRRLEKMPEAAKLLTPEGRKFLRTLGNDARPLAEKTGTLGQHLDAMLKSARTTDARKAAVTAFGAVDDLDKLMAALGNAEFPDLRDQAVLVLRHWLGREPGQSIKLYQSLQRDHQYTAIQAKSLLHLLHGIEPVRRQQPGTYDLLIEDLQNRKLFIRELARWHLVRLAPEGKNIPYDAAGSEEQRRNAIAAWRRLIPEGELPPHLRKSTP